MKARAHARRKRGHLVCIPHAGGGAAAYARWHTNPDFEIAVVPLPGRDGNYSQPCLTSIREMAQRAAAFIHEEKLEGVVLFGHSMGALVAYESAKLLGCAGPQLIDSLFVSGCQCPTSFTSDCLSEIGDDQEFIRAVAEYGGLAPELLREPGFIEYVLPILRADLAACDTYRYEPHEPLDVPLVAFAGATDTRVPLDHVFGWRKFTTRDFDACVFPGGHFFINANADSILAAIRDRSMRSAASAEPAYV